MHRVTYRHAYETENHARACVCVCVFVYLCTKGCVFVRVSQKASSVLRVRLLVSLAYVRKHPNRYYTINITLSVGAMI